MKRSSLRALTVISVASLGVSGIMLGASAQTSALGAVANAAVPPDAMVTAAPTIRPDATVTSASASLPDAVLPPAMQHARSMLSELRREEVAAARAGAERLARAEAERVARAEAERVAAERAEAERVAAERAEAERVAAERAEAERVAAERAEAERVAAMEQAQRDRAAQGAASRSTDRGGSAKAIAADLVAARGWSSSQFDCLDSLWTKESGWKVSADNPSSSAYGIPQALPGSKMASAGADWRTNPHTQITWGLGYIEDRYGSPCGAWSHSKSHNWY